MLRCLEASGSLKTRNGSSTETISVSTSVGYTGLKDSLKVFEHDDTNPAVARGMNMSLVAIGEFAVANDFVVYQIGDAKAQVIADTTLLLQASSALLNDITVQESFLIFVRMIERRNISII